MANIKNLESFLTDVASAIKQKTGKEEKIPAENFDTEILSIETGGGLDGEPIYAVQDYAPNTGIEFPYTNVGLGLVYKDIIAAYAVKSSTENTIYISYDNNVYEVDLLENELISTSVNTTATNKFIVCKYTDNYIIFAYVGKDKNENSKVLLYPIKFNFNTRRIEKLNSITLDIGTISVNNWKDNIYNDTLNLTAISYENHVSILFIQYDELNNTMEKKLEIYNAGKADYYTNLFFGEYLVCQYHETGSANIRYFYTLYHIIKDGNVYSKEELKSSSFYGNTSSASQRDRLHLVISRDASKIIFDGKLYEFKDNVIGNVLKSSISIGSAREVLPMNDKYWYYDSKLYELTDSYDFVQILSNISCDGHSIYKKTNNSIVKYNFIESENIIGYSINGKQYVPYSQFPEVQSSHLLEGKTLYNKLGSPLVGTMPDNGPINITPSMQQQSIPLGYTSGGVVKAIDYSNTLTPSEYLSCLAKSKLILGDDKPYTLVDYIITDGSQYFDTDVTPASWIDVEISFISLTKVKESWRRLLGTKTDCGFEMATYDGPETLRVSINGTTNQYFIRDLSTTEKNTVKLCGNGDVYKNGSLVHSHNVSYNSSEKIRIFGAPSYSNIQCKFYEAKIWNTKELIHHYIPVLRNSDVTFQIYDLVDKKFVISTGTYSGIKS